MDKDFGEMVYRSGKSHKGVLLLRLEDQDRQTKIDVLSHKGRPEVLSGFVFIAK